MVILTDEQRARIKAEIAAAPQCSNKGCSNPVAWSLFDFGRGGVIFGTICNQCQRQALTCEVYGCGSAATDGNLCRHHRHLHRERFV